MIITTVMVNDSSMNHTMSDNYYCYYSLTQADAGIVDKDNATVAHLAAFQGLPQMQRWCKLNRSIVRYNTLGYTMLYYTILYYIILYLYYAILYYTVLHYTILYYTVLYYTICYYVILCYAILYYTVLDTVAKVLLQRRLQEPQRALGVQVHS